MEFAENGNLNSLLEKQTEPIEWLLRMKWSVQISNALTYIHQSHVVHRDLRCVNILITKDLDIKISDFGISVWFNETGEIKKKPVYVGGKMQYDLANDTDTLQYQYDIRLFGIVLNKLLLFGESVNEDKYNWKTNTIKVECDLQSYSDLIHSCFHPNINTPYISAFSPNLQLP